MLPTFDALLPWIHQYGYGAIFVLLLLGIVGLPVPDEWLLLFSGFLVQSHELHPLPTLATAFAGASAGISVSYLVGRGPGRLLVSRWGFLLHLDQARLDRVRGWYDRRGRWLLTFSFYIPGVRHLVAIVAGTSAMRWPEFALFAYSGALLWTATFLAAGYGLGQEWRTLAEQLRRHEWLAGAGLALLLVVLAGIRYWLAHRKPRKDHHE